MADLAKLVEELSQLSLLEAAELTKMLEQKWGVSAAAPMATIAGMPSGVGTGAAAAAEEEKTEFDVILKDVGVKKINVIKAVRVVRTDLGLKEAKDLVDGAPATVLAAVNKEVAQDAKTKLEAEGATVEIK